MHASATGAAASASCLSTPTTDRGVAVTIRGNIMINDNDFSMCIDWFQVTILSLDVTETIKYFFGYDLKELVCLDTGTNGYNRTYTIGDKIRVMYNTIRSDMGVNILMSGSACREFEEMYTWQDLIKKISSLPPFIVEVENSDGDKIVYEKQRKKPYNVNRIDIAIDMFSDLFTVKDIQYKLDKKEVVTKFRQYQTTYTEQTFDSSRLSETVTLGSKSSLLYIVFYNKLLERKNEGYEFKKEIDHWLRCEMRFKQDMAKNLFESMVLEYDDISKYIYGTLSNWIDFKERSLTDSKKYRWNTVSWWSTFTYHAVALKIQKQSVTSSIVKKRRYADMALQKFFTLLVAADPKFIYEFLNKGKDKVKQKDLENLNRYFLQHNMQQLKREDFNRRVDEIKEYYKK